MLEIRPDCETCGRDLPNGDPDAVMCTFECTFCSACAHNVHDGICPNCAGNLTTRPTRPKHYSRRSQRRPSANTTALTRRTISSAWASAQLSNPY